MFRKVSRRSATATAPTSPTSPMSKVPIQGALDAIQASFNAVAMKQKHNKAKTLRQTHLMAKQHSGSLGLDNAPKRDNSWTPMTFFEENLPNISLPENERESFQAYAEAHAYLVRKHPDPKNALLQAWKMRNSDHGLKDLAVYRSGIESDETPASPLSDLQQKALDDSKRRAALATAAMDEMLPPEIRIACLNLRWGKRKEFLELGKPSTSTRSSEKEDVERDLMDRAIHRAITIAARASLIIEGQLHAFMNRAVDIDENGSEIKNVNNDQSTDPKKRRSMKEFAEMHGLPHEALYRWRHYPEVRAYLRQQNFGQ